MTKSGLNKKFTFEFDEQGKNEVSEQIMDSYNMGFIDGKPSADREELGGTEG